MPQDVKLSPDGRTFFVADMARGGVWTIAARTWRVEGFLPTGAGAHGLYPSRDARELYITNRAAGTVSDARRTSARSGTSSATSNLADGIGPARALLEALIASTEDAGIWTIQSGIFPLASITLPAARGRPDTQVCPFEQPLPEAGRRRRRLQIVELSHRAPPGDGRAPC